MIWSIHLSGKRISEIKTNTDNLTRGSISKRGCNTVVRSINKLQLMERFAIGMKIIRDSRPREFRSRDAFERSRAFCSLVYAEIFLRDVGCVNETGSNLSKVRLVDYKPFYNTGFNSAGRPDWTPRIIYNCICSRRRTYDRARGKTRPAARKSSLETFRTIK